MAEATEYAVIRALPWPVRLIAYAIGSVLAFVLFVALTSWIGSSIPRGDKLEEVENPVVIMVETNGMHTQLVLPVVHEEKDWRETFPTASELVNGWRPTHVSIGFGEREVFLNTPTLSDVRLSTVLRVAGFGGDALIRVSNLVNPSLDHARRELRISREQYARLVAAIEADLPPLDGAGFRTFEGSAYDDEPYYQSSRGYTVLRTCNQWTSNKLADAGIRTGLWTPFSGGVMKWVPPHTTELGSR